jgi:hypothetical protein
VTNFLIVPATALVADEGLGHALVTIGIVLLIAFALPFVMAWLEPARSDQPKRATASRPPANGARLRSSDRLWPPTRGTP